MGVSRYMASTKLKGGTVFGSIDLASRIRKGIENRSITYTTYIIKEDERIEQIAGRVYGQSSYWWAIAAASGIGWGLQVPPGTLLKIPPLGTVLAMTFSKI